MRTNLDHDLGTKFWNLYNRIDVGGGLRTLSGVAENTCVLIGAAVGGIAMQALSAAIAPLTGLATVYFPTVTEIPKAIRNYDAIRIFEKTLSKKSAEKSSLETLCDNLPFVAHTIMSIWLLAKETFENFCLSPEKGLKKQDAKEHGLTERLQIANMQLCRIMGLGQIAVGAFNCLQK